MINPYQSPKAALADAPEQPVPGTVRVLRGLAIGASAVVAVLALGPVILVTVGLFYYGAVPLLVSGISIAVIAFRLKQPVLVWGTVAANAVVVALAASMLNRASWTDILGLSLVAVVFALNIAAIVAQRRVAAPRR